MNAETRAALRDKLAEWKQQLDEHDAWIPGRPMKLSQDEAGQLSECYDALDTLLAPPPDLALASRLRALADRPIYSGPDLVELREALLALAAESEAP